MQQALCEDLSASGQARMVMIQSLGRFCHCSLHEVGFIDFCCLGIINFFSLAPLPAQLAARMVVGGGKTGPPMRVALADDPAR